MEADIQNSVSVFSTRQIAADVMKRVEALKYFGIQIGEVQSGECQRCASKDSCTFLKDLPHAVVDTEVAGAYRDKIEDIIAGEKFEYFHDALLDELRTMYPAAGIAELRSRRSSAEGMFMLSLEPAFIDHQRSLLSQARLMKSVFGSTLPNGLIIVGGGSPFARQ